MAAKSRRNKRGNSNGVQRLLITNLDPTNSGDTYDSLADNHLVEHNPPQSNPLNFFKLAKGEINDLYQRLQSIVNRAAKFYSEDVHDRELLEYVDIERLKGLNRSIETIRNILSRNHMKVAFFGHTSNGKSTVINAILHDNVLPRGYGVTTKCFLQIQGTQEQDAYVLVQRKNKSEEKQSIAYVSQMANALNRNSLECSTLLKIFWPVSKCALLNYDVVFVDSPGVNVDANLDEWIDDYCHDADLFVLVSSSESTLNMAEMNFFDKVSKKLSRPNVFILNNRFDIIDQNEPDSLDSVREQHLERAVDFLHGLNPKLSEDEAKKRTFFVSAKETLESRCPSVNVRSIGNSKDLSGYQDRSHEFMAFEKRFEESLSKSAVKTKFMQHCDRGKEIINELTSVLKNSQSIVARLIGQRQQELRKHHQRKTIIDTEFYKKKNLLQVRMTDVKNSIIIMISLEFHNELKRLSTTVEEFQESVDFSTNPHFMSHYKSRLYSHIERSMSENLRIRVEKGLMKHVGWIDTEIYSICKLLSDERKKAVMATVNSQNYVLDDLIDLKIYEQFYAKFQEDLEFRFSFGLVSIIRKFRNKFSPTKSDNPSDQLYNSIKADTDVLSFFERFLMNPPQSPTTVGSLAVGGVLVRTVGWKVILWTTVVYGALYAYEYLTWTNAAKKRAFKAQYVRYAQQGLEHCSRIIGQHVAGSVEQKMITNFTKLEEEIGSEYYEITEKSTWLEQSLGVLDVCDKFTSELMGENDVLFNQMLAFALSYLSS